MCKDYKTSKNKDKPYHSLWEMIPFRAYLNVVRIEYNYLGLGELLILSEYKCLLTSVIKKGFTRKDTGGY